METIFLIVSSSHPEEPYKLHFWNDGSTLKLRCFCPAGAEQMLCKHLLGLLARKTEFLFNSGQVEALDDILALLDRGGTLECNRQLLSAVAALEAEFKIVKKEFEKKRAELKSNFCTKLREGVGLILLIALGILISLPQAKAQGNNPTLKETVVWLKTQLVNRASFSVGKGESVATQSFEPISFEDCELKWRQIYQMKSPMLAPTAYGSEITFNLSSLQEEKTRISPNDSVRPLSFEIFAKGGFRRQSITKEKEAETRGAISNPESIVFVFSEDDRDLLPRISKALSYAAGLCRKQKEPF